MPHGGELPAALPHGELGRLLAHGELGLAAGGVLGTGGHHAPLVHLDPDEAGEHGRAGVLDAEHCPHSADLRMVSADAEGGDAS
eukprot:251937-Heterocapsa_arctica.AAC.1